MPSHKEFDNSEITVSANDEDSAWERVRRTKMYIKSEVTLTKVNGQKVNGRSEKPPVKEVLDPNTKDAVRLSEIPKKEI